MVMTVMMRRVVSVGPTMMLVVVVVVIGVTMAVVLAHQCRLGLVCDDGACYGAQRGLELALVAQLVAQHATADATDGCGYEAFLAILGMLVLVLVLLVAVVVVVVLGVTRAVVISC